MSGPHAESDEKDEWQPPTEDEIRERAYHLYLLRRRERAVDDWIEAEAELYLRRTRSDD
jgi:hypothetical protein